MNDGVVRLGLREVPGVVEVLCDSFSGYPVMRFVLGPDDEGSAERLRRFVHFAVMARVYRGEFILGIGDGDTLQGAALVSRPSVSESPPELAAHREELWRELGPAARARYEAYGAATAPFIDPTPHLHLNMLGVRHTAHGKGYARMLLDHVHALSRDDPASNGVSLETELEKNVRLYEHFGYRLVGQTEFAPGLTSWGFFRPNA